MSPVQKHKCFLCGGTGQSKHHLTPVAVRRQRGSRANAIVRSCFHCHKDIHFYISHWELVHRYNTEEKLREELLERMAEDGRCVRPPCDGRCMNPNCKAD